jgi:hypothetical protein
MYVKWTGIKTAGCLVGRMVFTASHKNHRNIIRGLEVCVCPGLVCCILEIFFYIYIYIYTKVKQSRYMPGVAQWVQGS